METWCWSIWSFGLTHHIKSYITYVRWVNPGCLPPLSAVEHCLLFLLKYVFTEAPPALLKGSALSSGGSILELVLSNMGAAPGLFSLGLHTPHPTLPQTKHDLCLLTLQRWSEEYYRCHEDDSYARRRGRYSQRPNEADLSTHTCCGVKAKDVLF